MAMHEDLNGAFSMIVATPVLMFQAENWQELEYGDGVLFMGMTWE